jgi:predicted transcriptional regulator
MTRDLTQRLYRGSAKSMVLNLLGNEKLSATDIDELKAAIASLEGSP